MGFNGNYGGFSSSTTSQGGDVTSVFGRTGAVAAQNNDYTFTQVGDKPTTIQGYGIADAYTKTQTDNTAFINAIIFG